MPYSLNETIKNLNISDFKDNFIKYPEFSLSDILKFYQLQTPAIKKSTVQWRVTRLLELGVIQRIGRGKYTIGNYRKFIPYPTSQIKKAHHHLISKFPDSKYCVWSTEWLKTYLTKLDVQIIFVEGIGNEPINFYFHLWEQRYCSVYYRLLDKVSKMFYKNSIVVRKMISGSPLTESEGIFYAHLEKIIVDLYCDWNLIYPHEKPTFQQLLKKLHKDFSINESKLLRYADRRKKKEIFIRLLKKLNK
ncbi:hypothetical protein HNP38_000068 [Chryseobacterium defluvii]|uniref:Uncharacterized protein n=1 Tax=Chryseobacterium defluvii TaxID=160396 RepID=A0A840K6E6_9FLAO|nr:DUF6577 family protein [Chryseobacterium defluvii]MBB4804796.1 hypothetical protein [Chryseobacterium defluvii]